MSVDAVKYVLALVLEAVLEAVVEAVVVANQIHVTIAHHIVCLEIMPILQIGLEQKWQNHFFHSYEQINNKYYISNIAKHCLLLLCQN
ncbi:hypothetical protein BN938_0584 [Mucinivorans hirudinis]|uniref:Uncharacterized protein n=1 Tax=Mucinivorans hirudinis TaxID=1433126 RepID=A0A060RBB3_9BACT|nr:hypothetical protein BN938_0584 [Mucinivorans hirudinis]